jgi:small-conductance mechanosensitive channel
MPARFWAMTLSPLLRSGLLALVIAFGLLVPGAGHAQSGSAATGAASAAEERARIEALVGALENEEQRQRLVGQLRLLLQAQQAEAGAEEVEDLSEIGLLFFGAVARDLSLRFGEVLGGIRPVLAMERLSDWARNFVSDPAARGRLFEFVLKLAAMLGAGFAAEMVTRWLLRGATRRLMTGDGAGYGARALRLLAAMALIGLPLGAFVLAASAVSPLVAAQPLIVVAVGHIVSGYLMVRYVRGAATLTLSPHDEFPRLLPVGRDTAAYLDVWIGRFAVIGIYGFSVLAAAQPLGLPFVVNDFLVRLLGLVLLGLAIVFVLQNREPVGAWIGSRGGAVEAAADGMGRLVLVLRGYLAVGWHVLAILYLGIGFVIWALGIEEGPTFLALGTLWTIAILGGAKLAAMLARRAVTRLFAVSAEMAQRHPLLESRANRYLSVLRTLLDVLIIAIALSAVLEVWGLRGLSWLTSDLGRALVGKLAALGITIVAAMIGWELVSALIEQRLRQLDTVHGAGPRSQRMRTFLPLLRNAAFVIIVGVSSLVVLSELGVNVAPLLAGAGVIGVAIGFGSQTLVKDVITGLFILFEDTVNVGDVVDLDGGHAGVVESLSIRSIRLRDVAGAQHTIPFSQVSTIKNMTKDFAYYVFDLSVAYDTDLEHVVSVLRAVDAEARIDPSVARETLEPIEVLGLDRFGDFSLTVRARIKTLPGKQWRIGRLYNARIKLAFARAGIEIPFPHQVEIVKHGDAEARRPGPAGEVDAALPRPG